MKEISQQVLLSEEIIGKQNDTKNYLTTSPRSPQGSQQNLKSPKGSQLNLQSTKANQQNLKSPKGSPQNPKSQKASPQNPKSPQAPKRNENETYFFLRTCLIKGISPNDLFGKTLYCLGDEHKASRNHTHTILQ